MGFNSGVKGLIRKLHTFHFLTRYSNIEGAQTFCRKNKKKKSPLNLTKSKQGSRRKFLVFPTKWSNKITVNFHRFTHCESPEFNRIMPCEICDRQSGNEPSFS